MRILLADHHVQPCTALKTALEEQPEFELIGEVTDAQALLELAEKNLPDLVLVDCELPGTFIEDLILRLHELRPKPTVIVMSSDFKNSRKLLVAGADAFLTKEDEPEWFLRILKKFENETRVENGV
jgi:DNA-binding NarL/FixJ family response regulator